MFIAIPWLKGTGGGICNGGGWEGLVFVCVCVVGGGGGDVVFMAI